MSKNYKSKDYTILLAGFLSATKLILSRFDITIKDQEIDAVVDIVAYGVGLYAIWKNTYVSRKSQAQRKELEKRKLIK